jgi:hypothetical protein
MVSAKSSKNGKRKVSAVRGRPGPALKLPQLRGVYIDILDAAWELERSPDALSAELWTVAAMCRLRTHAPDDGLFRLALMDLIAQADRRGGVEARALLDTMSAIGPHGLADAAARAADRVAARFGRTQGACKAEAGADVPSEWRDLLAQVETDECYLCLDAFGEYSQLLCVFTHRHGGVQHALTASIDHAYHGVLADLNIVTGDKALVGLTREMERGARRHSGAFSQISAAEASELLRGAVAAASRPGLPHLATGPQPGPEFYAILPWAISRITAMPGGLLPQPAPVDLARAWPPSRRNAMADDFVKAHPGRFTDPALAGMLAARYIDLSVKILGREPDRIGPAYVTRLFGEVLPRTLTMPDVILREAEKTAGLWLAWLTASTDVPKAAVRALEQTTKKVMALYPKACRDHRVNPNYPYAADLGPEMADGDRLNEAFDRRSFAVPFPEDRCDGLAELPDAVGGLRSGHTRAGDLNAGDPFQRSLIVRLEASSAGADARRLDHHCAVAEQIWTDTPRQTWQAAERLQNRGWSRTRIMAALADAWQRHRPDSIADDADFADGYLVALEALGTAMVTR